MLDSSITGLTTLSKDTERLLNQGTIHPLSRVVITRTHKGKPYETEVRNVISYSISEERQFGAASLSLTASNHEGKYSYSNLNSDVNYIFINSMQSVSLDFSYGDHASTVNVGSALGLVSGMASGEWTSQVLSGGGQFHSWREIGWQISSGKYIRDDTYYGTVIVLARFGDVGDTAHESWTGWQTVATITGPTNNNMLIKSPIVSHQRYAQVKVLLYAAYEVVSPMVYRLQLHYFTNAGEKIKSPLYYYGNKIEVYEGILSMDESKIDWQRVFMGFIDTVSPSQSEDDMSLTCEALDYMKICLNDYIEKPDPSLGEDDLSIFEPAKFEANIQLEMVLAPGHDDDGDGNMEVVVFPEEEGSIFRVPIRFRNNGPIRGYESDIFEGSPLHDRRGDFMYQPWAELPRPIVFVEDDDGTMVEYKGGFDIDYQRGAIYFNEILEKPNGQIRKVQASFFWYNLDTNRFEDVAGEIIARAIQRFGMEKPKITTNTKDYVIWTAKTHDIKIILERSEPRSTIPPIGYKLDDRKTFFDALSEIRQYITPDYLLRATPRGDFVGEHLPQKVVADYKLSLVSDMSVPISEEQIYTRCVSRGVQSSTRNIATGKGVTVMLSGPGSFKRYGSGSKALVDGNYNTNCGWYWESNPSRHFPAEMFKVSFKEPFRLGAINVLIGDGPEAYSPCYPSCVTKIDMDNIGFTLDISRDGRTWYPLTDQSHTGSSAQWIRIDKADFDSRVSEMKVKHIRFMMTSTDSFTYGHPWGSPEGNIAGKKFTMYAWAIREIQVFKDETIRAEVTIRDLADVGDIPLDVALDMQARLGTKTIVLPENPTLRSYEQVQKRALDYLYEGARNLYTSDVDVIYVPHIRVGHTVSLYNPYLIGENERTYYVDGVTRDMDGNEPSVSVKLVSWT